MPESLAPGWLLHLEEGGDLVTALSLVARRIAPGGARLDVYSRSASAPVASAGPYLLLLDGVLDDHRRLAASHGLSTDATGAKVALTVVERSGAAALAELRGSFALALFDEREPNVLALRDPSGAVPLLFASSGEGVILARSVDAISACPGIAQDPDSVRMASHLLGLRVSPARTFLRSVRRLAPGVVWRLTPDGGPPTAVTCVRRPSPSPVEQAHAHQRFDELLETAVSRSFALGRVAVLLSGGVDSGSVAAVAADLARAAGGDAPLALSLVFPGAAAAEEAAERELARALGLQHLVLPVEEVMGIEPLRQAVRSTRETAVPRVNPWSFAYDRLVELAAERGRTVVVSGELADVVLALPADALAQALARGDLAGAYDLWRSRRAYSWRPLRSDLHWLLWHASSRRLLLAAARSAAELVGARDRTRRLRLARRCPGWALPDRSLREAVYAEALAATDWRVEGGIAGELVAETLRDYAMERLERGGALPTEPYADADLVSFVLGLSAAELNWGGRAKGLARQTIARRAGEAVAATRSAYYVDDYLIGMLRAEGPQVIAELGRPSTLQSLGLVARDLDERRLSAAVATLGAGSGLTHYDIWTILCLEVWARSRQETR